MHVCSNTEHLFMRKQTSSHVKLEAAGIEFIVLELHTNLY